jgi:glycosyltransferase involved in cell wall biosynthesis
MVGILLATYNGGNRLHIQIQSIINQTFEDWILYIRDDGSNDDTLSICRYYANKDKRIRVVEDEVKHRGAKGSFIWLLEHVDAEYYMFSDQDDMWLPNKISLSLRAIQEKGIGDKPVCIYTDLAVADSNYNVISSSLWKTSKVKPYILENKYYIQVFNCVTGCTMIFNRKAKLTALPFDERAPMHDFWVAYKILEKHGILSHISDSTILYCQHGNNAVGANRVNFSYVVNKFVHIKDTINKNYHIYRSMHSFSGISIFKFAFCKFSYELLRLF